MTDALDPTPRADAPATPPAPPTPPAPEPPSLADRTAAAQAAVDALLAAHGFRLGADVSTRRVQGGGLILDAFPVLVATR